MEVKHETTYRIIEFHVPLHFLSIERDAMFHGGLVVALRLLPLFFRFTKYLLLALDHIVLLPKVSSKRRFSNVMKCNYLM
jgi:hypothetical protein